MISDLQKLGGISALIEAALYVTGFALFLTVLDPSGYEGHVQRVAFLADNQVASYIANLLIYVVFGVVLVVLVLAMHARLKNGSPAVMQTATAFGLIWAGLVIASGMIANIGNSAVVDLFGENQDQAVSLWLAIITVQEALGGGNEIVGGLWVLLLSWAALRAGNLPKVLNYLGVLVGLAGILTVVPAFDVLMDVFGLGQIVWFAWLGIVMLRENPSAT
ncbi:MAG: DUF4386 family protein [bacterium]|jgi:hypothetical protein